MKILLKKSHKMKLKYESFTKEEKKKINIFCYFIFYMYLCIRNN